MASARARTRPQFFAASSGPGLALLLAPSLVFLLFVGLPVAALAARALDSGELGRNLSSGLVLEALRLSAITSTVTLVLAIIFGTPVAYLLARRSFPGRSLLDLLIDLPVVLPPTVAGVALLVTFGRRGVAGEQLAALGLEVAFTQAAVVLAQLFVSAPFYIRTLKAGIESVSIEYEEIAATLGAGQARIFRRVLLPLVWPSVLAGAVLCWARALSELGATLVFAGNFPGRTQTLPLAIIGVFDSGRSIDFAIALAVILVGLAAVLLLLLRWAGGLGARWQG